MKPRTEREREVWRLFSKLPSISEKQKKYAVEHCFEKIGYKCGGLVWCTCCGIEFGYKCSDLSVSIGVGDKITCPRCGKELKLKVSTKRKIEDSMYYTIVTTIQGWQVLRHYVVERYMVRVSRYIDGCQEAKYSIREAVQNWIDSEGKEVIVARPRAMCPYYDRWVFSKPMEIRRQYNGYSYNPDPYEIHAYAVYPYMGILPIIRRNGLKGKLPDIGLRSLVKALLTDSRAETLMKAGQFSILKNLCLRGGVSYWHSVLIAIRNKYTIEDVNLWNDMLQALVYLGKDTRNAHYVCPKNLKESHDFWVKSKRKKMDKISREKKRKDDLFWEEEYRKKKEKFFGTVIQGDNIVISVIKSVKEMQEEGDIMHHCVATNGYYKNDESLILSAKDSQGERLETIEVSLKTFEVVQCFGKFNRKTEFHEKILGLMKNNMGIIKRAYLK